MREAQAQIMYSFGLLCNRIRPTWNTQDKGQVVKSVWPKERRVKYGNIPFTAKRDLNFTQGVWATCAGFPNSWGLPHFVCKSLSTTGVMNTQSHSHSGTNSIIFERQRTWTWSTPRYPKLKFSHDSPCDMSIYSFFHCSDLSTIS